MLCAGLVAGAQQLHTMKVMKEGDFMSPPVIRLGSDERISINFDEWSEDYSDLQYRLIHCGPDWKPTRLLESEYLDGFNIADIEDWAYSDNTFVHYVNYQLYIPDAQMNPKLPGNYIVEFFKRDDPERVIGKARFSVAEDVAQIAGNVSTQTDRGSNDSWQQLELEVTPTNVKIENPFQDITVTIVQNGDPATERIMGSPSRLDGKTLIYSHQPQLIFNAGNEYRRFESVSTNSYTMHVDSMRYAGRNYHAWLTPDLPRAESEYSYDETQQGRFMVRESNATDSNLGADYLTVHFMLDTPELTGADVYVAGEFTGYRQDAATRMRYDHGDGVYRLEMPLKQGSYNYKYVVAPHGKSVTPETMVSNPIEGDKYETRNEYLVQVWYHPVGARYPRLIASQKI